MLFPLWSLSIHLKLFAGEYFSLLDLVTLHSHCCVGIMRVVCAVCKDVDVVLLSMFLCMLHWLVGFSTPLN
jgi:hypothetical protein